MRKRGVLEVKFMFRKPYYKSYHKSMVSEANARLFFYVAISYVDVYEKKIANNFRQIPLQSFHDIRWCAKSVRIHIVIDKRQHFLDILFP